MKWKTVVKVFFVTLVVAIAGFAGLIVYEVMLERQAHRMEALFENTTVEFESKQETLGEFLEHFERFAKMMEPRLEEFEFAVANEIDLDARKEVHFGPPGEPESLSKRLETELLTYSTYFGRELNQPAPLGESVLDTIPVHAFRGNRVVILSKSDQGSAKWSEKIYHAFADSEVVGEIRRYLD